MFKNIQLGRTVPVLFYHLSGTNRPRRKENIMYKDETIIFIDTDTLTTEEQEKMIQEENKNEQTKEL